VTARERLQECNGKPEKKAPQKGSAAFLDVNWKKKLTYNLEEKNGVTERKEGKGVSPDFSSRQNGPERTVKNNCRRNLEPQL